MRKKYIVIIYSVTIFIFFVFYLSLDKNKIYTTQDIIGKKIAKAGKIKYFKYFNSEIISDYIVSRTLDLKTKKKIIW